MLVCCCSLAGTVACLSCPRYLQHLKENRMSQIYEGNCSYCGQRSFDLCWSDTHKMFLCHKCFYSEELPPRCECCGQVILN